MTIARVADPKAAARPGHQLERCRTPGRLIPQRVGLLQLRDPLGHGAPRGRFELGREANPVFAAPREDDEQRLVADDELHEDGGCVWQQRIDVGAARRCHQAPPGSEPGQTIEQRLLLRRALRAGLGDRLLEARDARRVGLGQPALARELGVQRHQLTRERPLLVALDIAHPARDVALARREQHTQVVGPHPLGRLERRRRIAVLGLQECQHGKGG